MLSFRQWQSKGRAGPLNLNKLPSMPAMRKALKFLHTLSACGIIGALLGYMILLMKAPQGTAAQYADMRASIDAICDYILMPSLGIALISGLLSMAVHKPFQDLTWAWIKALLGISMFEATLAIVNAKSDYAARLSAEIAAGADKAQELAQGLASEWTTLWAIMAISVANIVLGVWRPMFKRRPARVPR